MRHTSTRRGDISKGLSFADKHAVLPKVNVARNNGHAVTLCELSPSRRLPLQPARVSIESWHRRITLRAKLRTLRRRHQLKNPLAPVLKTGSPFAASCCTDDAGKLAGALTDRYAPRLQHRRRQLDCFVKNGADGF